MNNHSTIQTSVNIRRSFASPLEGELHFRDIPPPQRAWWPREPVALRPHILSCREHRVLNLRLPRPLQKPSVGGTFRAVLLRAYALSLRIPDEVHERYKIVEVHLLCHPHGGGLREIEVRQFRQCRQELLALLALRPSGPRPEDLDGRARLLDEPAHLRGIRGREQPPVRMQLHEAGFRSAAAPLARVDLQRLPVDRTVARGKRKRFEVEWLPARNGRRLEFERRLHVFFQSAEGASLRTPERGPESASARPA